MNLRNMLGVALFSALALVLNVIEGAFPMPLPGMKLGAANVFTLAALVLIGVRAAFAVSLLRVFLAWLISGNWFAFLCSLFGALSAAAVMSFLYAKYRDRLSVRFISMAGAWAFNAAQVAAVAALVREPKVSLYIFPLLAVGTVAGYAIGFAAEIVCRRLKSAGLFGRDAV